MKLKLWSSDAKSLGEKIFSSAAIVGIVGLYAFMQLSAAGLFKNMYQASVAAAGFGWHVAGLVLSAFTVLFTLGTAKDANYVTKDDTANSIIIGLSAVLSFLAYGGFSFNG